MKDQQKEKRKEAEERRAALDAMTPRERFISQQAAILDEMFVFTSGEEETRRRFEAMAVETFDALEKAGIRRPYPFFIEPISAFNFITRDSDHARVPAPIVNQWSEWRDKYPDLLERNPKLALHDMLSDLSETHTAASWPIGYEDRILEWVDSGRFHPFPVDDRMKIITPGFFERLAEIRRRCRGWLFWNDEICEVVFVADNVSRSPL